MIGSLLSLTLETLQHGILQSQGTLTSQVVRPAISNLDLGQWMLHRLGPVDGKIVARK